MSEGSGSRRGFSEKVVFEPRSEGWVGTDRDSVGRGEREGKTAFLVRSTECQRGH